MAETDDNSPPNDNNEQLAEKLSCLNAEQHALYRNQVDNNYELNGKVSREYQLKLADSLLKNLAPNELSREVKELNRQEYQYTYWREQSGAGKQAKETRLPIQEPHRPEQSRTEQIATPEPRHNDPLEGKIPNAPPRNYTKVQKTHEDVAALSKQGERPTDRTNLQSTQPASEILSKENLQVMSERFAEMRLQNNLVADRAEMSDRATLTGMQNADRLSLEKTFTDQPNRKQQEQLSLLSDQHFAEQVGVDAKWIARHLRGQDSPEADNYSAESRVAFQTARHIHEQRQNLGEGIDQSKEAARTAQSDHQKQSDLREALRGGKELTPDQRANVSPDAKQTMERTERIDTVREAPAMPAKDQNVQKGNTGKSPGGGRGR